MDSTTTQCTLRPVTRERLRLPTRLLIAASFALITSHTAAQEGGWGEPEPGWTEPTTEAAPAGTPAAPAAEAPMVLDEAELAASDDPTSQTERASEVEESDETHSVEYSGERSLNGHHFLLSHIVAHPFTPTNVELSLGAGLAFITVPGVNAEGMAEGETTYKAGAVQLAGRFQLALTDFFAIRGEILGAALAGADLASALNVGGLVDSKLAAGATLAFPLGDAFQLGATASLTYGNSFAVRPLAPLQNSVAQGKLTADGLFTEETGVDVRGGAAFALAPSPHFGLYGSAQVGNNAAGSESTTYLTAGLNSSIDFITVPVGILLAYNTTYEFETTGSTTHDFAGGLFYTGRANLQVGVEAGYQNIQTKFSKLEGITAIFALGYFW